MQDLCLRDLSTFLLSPLLSQPLRQDRTLSNGSIVRYTSFFNMEETPSQAPSVTRVSPISPYFHFFSNVLLSNRHYRDYFPERFVKQIKGSLQTNQGPDIALGCPEGSSFDILRSSGPVVDYVVNIHMRC